MASSAQNVPLDQGQNKRTRTSKQGDLSGSQVGSTNPPPPAGGPLLQLSVEQTLFNQRKRMRVTQLRAMYAEAYREIEEETALIKLRSAGPLATQASRPSGTQSPVPTAAGGDKTAAAAAAVEATKRVPELLPKGKAAAGFSNNAAGRADDRIVRAVDVTMEEMKIGKDTAKQSRVPGGGNSAVQARLDVSMGKATARQRTNTGDREGAVPPTSARKTQAVRSVVGRAPTAVELLGRSHGAPLKRPRPNFKGDGKEESSLSFFAVARSHTVANDGAASGSVSGGQSTKARGNRDAFYGGGNTKNKHKPNSTPVGVSSSGAPETHKTNLASRATGGPNHPAATKHRKSARNSAALSAEESGPFSELSICAVRLGSVTKKTVATWTREVGRGGGLVTTSYAPGETTHILVDVSVSWATLERHGAGSFGGLVAVADDGGGAALTAGQGNVNDMATMSGQNVPVVGTGWMVECLTRSAVVDIEPYRMIRPPSLELPLPIEPAPVAGVATAPADKLSPATVTLDASTVAATTAHEEVIMVGTKDARQACQSVERSMGKTGFSSCMNSATMPSRLRGAREDREGKRKGVKPAGDGEARVPAAVLEAGAFAGGIGAANPNIATQRSKFFCQSGSSRDYRPCNEQAASSLENLAEMYAVLNGSEDVWRAKGLKRAAAVMRGLGVNITCFDQIKEIKKNEPARMRGIGDSVMAMLEDFFSDGKMGRLEGLSSVGRVRAMKELTGIWGVGPKTAEELIEAGLHTVEDVRRLGRHKLNRHQLVGLDRYEDLLERMPRSEAAEIEATVAQAARRLCPGVQCQACGSYRRGKETCGDVDVLIQPPEGEEDCPILEPLLDSLRASGFLTDDLALPRHHEPGSPQSYMGVCKLPGEGRRHRRLDVKLYPTSMAGFALLYFTGSGHFNRSMRYFAKLKGLSLSDKGLRPVNRVSGKKVHTFRSVSFPLLEWILGRLNSTCEEAAIGLEGLRLEG